MKKHCLIVLLALCSLFFQAQVKQDSAAFKPQFRHGYNYSVLTSIGMVYTGYPVSETKDFISIENRTTHEVQEIRKSTIVESRILKENSTAGLLPFSPNKHCRNYLLGEAAFLFEEKTLYMNSHWLLMERFDYAFTENFEISMNTLAFYPFTLGAKTSFQVGSDDYIGAGIFGVANVNSGREYSWFLGYGALAKYTKGNENNNLTLSGGIIGVRSDFFVSYTSRSYILMPVLNAAWCNRFREHIALNLEGWYLPYIDAGMLGMGFKFIGDDYSCWTLGCFALINGNDRGVKLNLKTLPLPYFGISRRFD